MPPSEVLYLGKSAILLVFYLSMPIIAAATAVGLIVALLQTMIQLQEQTLGFAAKLVTVIAMIAITSSWMSAELMRFYDQILFRIGFPG